MFTVLGCWPVTIELRLHSADTGAPLGSGFEELQAQRERAQYGAANQSPRPTAHNLWGKHQYNDTGVESLKGKINSSIKKTKQNQKQESCTRIMIIRI